MLQSWSRLLLAASLLPLAACPEPGPLPEPPPPAVTFRDVTYADGLFVAVGNLSGGDARPTDAYVSVSPDGEQWTTTRLAGAGIPAAVAHGAGRWLVVGGEWLARGGDSAPVGMAVTSDDGLYWRVAAAPPALMTGLAFGDGAFLAVSHHGEVVRSVDGAVWSAPAVAGEWYFPEVDRIGAGFVAYGEGVMIGESVDGAAWRRTDLGMSTVSAVVDLGDRLVAAATNVEAFGEGPNTISHHLFERRAGGDWSYVKETGAEVADLVRSGDAVIAATRDGLAIATGEPRSWRWQPVGIFDAMAALAADGEGTVVAAGDRLAVSHDHGRTWQAVAVAVQP